MKFFKNYGYVIFFTFLILSLFDFRFSIIAIVCMLAPIILAILGMGRFWCGNFCPRGSFFDKIMSKLSPNNNVHPFFKSKFLRIFMVVFIFANFIIGIVLNWGNLYGIGKVFYRIIVITTIVGVILALFNNRRTWCNFCPMGTIAGWITKVKGKKTVITVDSSCLSCNLCKKVCPMNIEPSKNKNSHIESEDCIYCSNCIYKCPKHSLKLTKK
ncbi:4Fe-4S binding protein [Clostridiaceae bacterium 14S0207]|nr:4Fe-4S binding protein [Clostridiaceae bacterium 14S0207]